MLSIIRIGLLLVFSYHVDLLPTPTPKSKYNNNKLLEVAKHCITEKHTFLCLKEHALTIIQSAIDDNRNIELNDYINVIKDPNFMPNSTFFNSNHLSEDAKLREEQLNKLLLKKFSDLFKSRTFKFNMPTTEVSSDEGRKKKMKKQGGMMMMMGMGMMAMMMKMALTKVTMMAGTALMTAKIALVISVIMALKKILSSPAKSEVVVTSNSDHGSQWHRSLVKDDDTSDLPYRAHNPNNY